MGCVECFEGLHVDLHPTHTAFCRRTRTALARRNASDTVVAEEELLRARLSGKAGWQGGVAGWVVWRARWDCVQGWVVGRVG